MALNKNRKLNRMINRSLVTYLNPQCISAAQFRAIRNNIDYASGGSKPRSLLITSPGSNEGKTNTTVNLAISMAQRGDKVLIIDANVRNPAIHDVFNTQISPGLINVLAGFSTIKDAVYSTEIGNLAVLPLGLLLSNSIELLNSISMDELLKLALDDYDCVIIDTAPVLDALDINTLASKCEGVVLVLKGGRTQRELALKAKHSLEFFGKAKIVGVVFNKALR